MALTKVTGQVIKNTTDVTVGVLTVTNTLAVGGTVSIGGTLTYEDVTNIDSVGLITARNGIVVGGGITLSKDGDIFFTGIATGNGSGLTNLPSAQLTGALPALDGSALTGVANTDVIFTDKISLGDNERINIGVGSDLKLSHDSNNSLIVNSTGELLIDSSIINLRDASNNSRLRIEPAGNVRVDKNINVVGIATVGSAVTISESGIEASGIGITCANINGGKIGGRRNLIVNGAMVIAQRATSSTAEGYTCDRYNILRAGVDESPTHAQVDVASGTTPYTNGFRKALKITNGNQTSGAGSGKYILARYKIESQDIARSGWNYTSSSSFIALSFWIKSSVAQNFYFNFIAPDGTAQNYAYETGALSADTWTKITKTIPGNSNLTFDNNNGIGLQLDFWAYAGTQVTSGSVTLNQWAAYSSGNRMPDHPTTWYTTNDATLELTGIQLEVGSQATPFEHRTFGDDYRDCLRYYYESRQDGNGFFTSPNNYSSAYFGFGLNGDRISAGVRFPVIMRDIPSTVEMIRPSDGSAAKAHIFRGVTGSNGGTDVDFGSVSAIDIGAHGFLYWSCGGSTVTQGAGYLFHIKADAEI